MRWVVCLVLALASCAPEQPEPASLLIEVSADGRIDLDGKPGTVNQLLAAVKGRSSKAVEVRADSDAIWMHVQWVLAALGEAGFTEVRCVFHGYPSPGFVVVPVFSGGVWDRLSPMDLFEKPELALGINITPAGSDRTPGERPRPEYRIAPWSDYEVITQNLRSLAGPARSLIRKHDVTHVVISPSGVMSYESVMELFVAMQTVGAGRVEIALEALHPWDRELLVLPPPQTEEPVFRYWVTDRTVHTIYPVNLPVADKAVQDKDNDPDDRVIVDLTAGGRLMRAVDREPVDITLAELGEQLATLARVYESKMAAQGKSGIDLVADGTRWSKLFVLLRADQDVSWQHVRWVLAELSAAKCYKLQFAARLQPGKDLTPMEAERKWAGRDICYPPIGVLEAKLSWFLATRPDPLDANFMDVAVEGIPARYTFGAKTTEDAETLTAWFATWQKNQDAESKIFARLRADPRTSLAGVIAAVNSFKSVVIEKVTFLDIELAPDEIRRARRLPR